MSIEQVFAPVLARLTFPDFAVSLLDMRIVQEATLSPQGLAALSLRPLSASAEKISQLEQEIRRAMLALPGVKEVAISWQAAPAADKSAPVPQPVSGVDKIVAVASCKGGVGKSTVAVSLAWALHAAGLKVGLLDLDIYGPSLPAMLNLPDPKVEMDRHGLFVPLRISQDGNLRALSVGFMAEASQALTWRGPMLIKMVNQLLHQTAWPNLDILLLDLPPGTGDVQMSLLRNILLDGVIIVSTPQKASLSDTLRAITLFSKASILGLVENMSYYVCPCCGNTQYLFGRDTVEPLARQTGLNFLGKIPFDVAAQSLTSDYNADSEMARPYQELAQKILTSIKKR